MVSLLNIPFRIVVFGLFGFAVCRLQLWLSYLDYFSGFFPSLLWMSLLKGIQFDSAILFSILGLFLLLLSIPIQRLQSSWLRPTLVWLSGIVLFILYAYSLIDSSYFGEVKRHIGAEILNITSDLGAIAGIAATSRLDATIQGVLILAVLFLIWYGFVIRPMRSQVLYPVRNFFVGVLGCLFTIAIIVLGIRGFVFSGRPINVADAFANQATPQQANLSLNPAYLSFRESMNHLKQRPLHLVNEEALQSFAQHNPQIFAWQKKQAIPSNKNIVFILLESWTSRYIDGLSGTSYKVTPFFDQLMQKSQVWENYYAAGQRSIIGIQAALTATPALPSQPTIGFGLEIKHMSRIAQIADQHHYRTLMMQTSKRRSFQMENIASALGFKEYYGQEDIPLLREYPQEQPRFGWDYEGLQFLAEKLIQKDSGEDAKATTQQVSEVVSSPAEASAAASLTAKEGKKPFFAFIFTGTTHEPFPKLPKEFELYPHNDRTESGYLNSLRYSDWALEQFFKRIENEPWYKDTIFILSADHTLNTKVDNKDVAEKEGALISNKDFRIPLLIYAPDGSLPPMRHQVIASQYDLLPSMMDLLGFNNQVSAFGHSLFDASSQSYAYLYQGDMLGFVNSKQWAFFNEQGIQSQSDALDEVSKQELEGLKLKLQYADKLLRDNQWAP
ncbi:LTA synthase family protein [Pelistega europaea]|uniref:LTA synthase family protein n=1 Tax=Pelistega europaea TaxID=106147 RepID=A0A7Y4LAQ6_9BURK|nr:LTA synthase family protein [Pelistega europaea]NOL49056.1 LTA synthase family protein [Pelistega europaea]